MLAYFNDYYHHCLIHYRYQGEHSSDVIEVSFDLARKPGCVDRKMLYGDHVGETYAICNISIYVYIYIHMMILVQDIAM